MSYHIPPLPSFLMSLLDPSSHAPMERDLFLFKSVHTKIALRFSDRSLKLDYNEPCKAAAVRSSGVYQRGKGFVAGGD